jgi:regulator of protease activity HflC (stomatin/prohibitin superfamily)
MKVFRKLLRHLTSGTIFVLILSTFVLVVFWNRMIIVIPAGAAGVKWELFFGGTRLTHGALQEGLHVIFPWDRIYTYNARLQHHEQDYDVVSRDALQAKVGVSFRWRIDPVNLARLHSGLGPNYLDSFLIPIIGSVTREVISQYDAADLVSSRRGIIQQRVYDEVVSRVNATGIGAEGEPQAGDMVFLRDVLIKNVVLPDQLRNAIERKLEQAQVVEEFRFRLERERVESQRKAVEAQGIESLNASLSEKYLKWRGIEATSELARSPNSKVIVIGGGAGGLPVIFNADGQSPATDVRAVQSSVPPNSDAAALSK